ncbi:MAG: DNA polymerase III subunit delta' [Deltaproteobacteria bacterium]|nr:DNA polymerase III subunit delta' [Deltaproteobacteria bacterium]
MSFAEIIGQQKPLTILRSALANGRLHHAYLFLGLEGVGKHTVAMAFAKAIHCGESDHDYCGGCVNCARIAAGNHPDVRVIEPLSGKKEISIAQIRELERELSYRSFTGKRKIAIIDPATLLNLSSQNALLKTLEEPPQDCLIILIAANGGALLPTLRSRCLRISFAPLARQDVAAIVKTRQGLSDGDAAFVAALSMGSIGAALALEKDEWIEKRRIWSGMLGALKTRDYQGAMAGAEALASNKDDALKFLKWTESWYRDLMLYQVSDDVNELVNLDMQEQISQQAKVHDVEHTLRAIGQVAGAAARIQRNLNRRMVLEKLLFGVVGRR